MRGPDALSQVTHRKHGTPYVEDLAGQAVEAGSESEIIRCLKRYVAREAFSVIQNSAEMVRRAA